MNFLQIIFQRKNGLVPLAAEPYTYRIYGLRKIRIIIYKLFYRIFFFVYLNCSQVFAFFVLKKKTDIFDDAIIYTTKIHFSYKRIFTLFLAGFSLRKYDNRRRVTFNKTQYNFFYDNLSVSASFPRTFIVYLLYTYTIRFHSYAANDAHKILLQTWFSYTLLYSFCNNNDNKD